jgi:SSS family solute:Na+ symporter
MQNVLELMLYSYAFMVSGLFVPVIGALFGKKSSTAAFGYAIWLTTILLILTKINYL